MNTSFVSPASQGRRIGSVRKDILVRKSKGFFHRLFFEATAFIVVAQVQINHTVTPECERTHFDFINFVSILCAGIGFDSAFLPKLLLERRGENVRMSGRGFLHFSKYAIENLKQDSIAVTSGTGNPLGCLSDGTALQDEDGHYLQDQLHFYSASRRPIAIISKVLTGGKPCQHYNNTISQNS